MVIAYSIIWSVAATKQLQKACRYIRKQSIQNAATFKSDVLSKAASLSENPSRYAADKLRIDKDERFRAIEIHHYRISYFVDEPNAEVVILQLRHTSQLPLEY